PKCALVFLSSPKKRYLKKIYPRNIHQELLCQ
ncbi:trefoil factor 2, partial [Chelydra serpentina]